MNKEWKCNICGSNAFEEKNDKIVCKNCGAFFTIKELDELLNKEKNLIIEENNKKEAQIKQELQKKKDLEESTLLFKLTSNIRETDEIKYNLYIQKKKWNNFF